MIISFFQYLLRNLISSIFNHNSFVADMLFPIYLKLKDTIISAFVDDGKSPPYPVFLSVFSCFVKDNILLESNVVS